MPATSAVFLMRSMGTFGWVVALDMSVPFLGGGRQWRRGGCRRSVGWDLPERDQGHADIAQLVKDAVQRGLIDDGTTDGGGAVVEGGDAQPAEPSLPPLPEMSLDADFVPLGGAVTSSRWPARCAGGGVVCAHTRTVRTDLVSAHHQIW